MVYCEQCSCYYVAMFLLLCNPQVFLFFFFFVRTILFLYSEVLGIFSIFFVIFVSCYAFCIASGLFCSFLVAYDYYDMNTYRQMSFGHCVTFNFFFNCFWTLECSNKNVQECECEYSVLIGTLSYLIIQNFLKTD